MRFEYKVVLIRWDNDHDNIETVLNRYGDAGWEAYDHRWHSGSHDWLTVTFKRSMSLVKWRHESGKEALLIAGVSPDVYPAEAAKWENPGPSAPIDTSDA